MAHDRRAALQRGALAESYVARCLEAQGWAVLDRNWRGHGGELDVVVARDGVVRFVEVKARAPDDPTGAEAITPSKRSKLIRAAEAWLLGQPVAPAEACFLVAVVDCGPEPWVVEWIDDAFDGR